MKRKPTLLDFQPHLDLSGRRVAVDPEARRIAVRVAAFGETHSGFGPEVKVPRNANLDAAHVGSADLADGSNLRVAVLPMDTAHAPANLAALHAASWYENSGKAVARGRYSSDEHGIRFDGLLFDDVDSARIDRITAASASGDWRSAIALKSFGDFEHTPADFVGSCIVNIGGYSDTYQPGDGQRLSLVASAAGDYISIEQAGDDGMKWDGTERRKKKLTADGAAELPDGCSGECTGCPCRSGGGIETAPTVTITAAALAALHLMASCDFKDESVLAAEIERTRPAFEEARTTLVATGYLQAPDPRDARIAALEQAVIGLAFQND